MKTNQLAETPARYGMRPAAFEKLLVELGWTVDGVMRAEYVRDGRLTPLAEGFLDGYFWQRKSR